MQQNHLCARNSIQKFSVSISEGSQQGRKSVFIYTDWIIVNLYTELRVLYGGTARCSGESVATLEGALSDKFKVNETTNLFSGHISSFQRTLHSVRNKEWKVDEVQRIKDIGNISATLFYSHCSCASFS